MAKNFVIDEEIYVKNGPTSIDGIGEKYDFSFTDDFWQLTTNGKIYQLNCIGHNGDIIKTLEFTSKEELKKEFTSLHDFLNIATFVGKEFNRKKPAISTRKKNIYAYMPEISISLHTTKYIVLYATQGLFLIKKRDPYFGERYALIDSRYTLDGNYIFYENTYDEYRDKNKVYREIFEQIGNCKKKIKIKKK